MEQVLRPFSLKTTARWCGALTMAMTLIAIVSMLGLPASITVAGDPVATAGNVAANAATFRASIIGDALIVLIELVLVVLLYELLKPVSRTLSLIAASARLGMIVLQGVNLVNRLVVAMLVTEQGAGTEVANEPTGILVSALFGAHEKTVLVWGLFFALHLLFLGYLTYRSGYIARFAGIALVAASVCYFVQSLGSFLLPQYIDAFRVIGFISIIELVFPIWLLIKGVDTKRLNEMHR